MSKREESNRNENIFFAQTHEIKAPFVTTRKQIKCTFLENERYQSMDYIKDLEATLAINKTIIADLLGKERMDSMSTLAKMNEENRLLLSELKESVKQRNDAQAKLLISDQLVEEYKKKEALMDKEYEEKEVEWLDQLNRKEYVLQVYQKTVNKATVELQRHARQNVELHEIIDLLNTDIDENGRIANVVIEKEALEKKLQDEANIIKSLQDQVMSLNVKNAQLLKLADPKRRPFAQITNMITNAGRGDVMGEKAGPGSLQLAQLRKENMQLYKLNEKLSKALTSLTKKKPCHKRVISEDIRGRASEMQQEKKVVQGRRSEMANKENGLWNFRPPSAALFGIEKGTKDGSNLSTIRGNENHDLLF